MQNSFSEKAKDTPRSASVARAKKRHKTRPLSQRRMCAAFMMPGYAQRPGSAFHPRQFRDQSRAALPSKIGPKALGLHTQSVLQLWKRHEMQKDPNEPGGEPTHVKASAL